VGRKILFVTTDQQRYDTLGCNGGRVARTPVLDAIAARGFRYERAQPQSVVCMPSRATILTGQHPATHGVWMNGVPLPVDAPSVARVLSDAGYRTALIGKSHFQPYFDPFARFDENRLGLSGAHHSDARGPDGSIGSYRGFDHLESATHGATGPLHYPAWLRMHHPEAAGFYYNVIDTDLEVNAAGGGDTGGPQIKHNEIPREWYHTDWVADRTIAWLDSLDDHADWFCWMSFPDPHHPWDPPSSELHRVDWRDLDLPAGYPVDGASRERILDDKPRHWRLWYDGDLVSNYEAPRKWVPATLTANQVREINALNHIEVELIDEALGRVLRRVDERGWTNDCDVVFTSDHGELQGDFGLMFKGPYHVDALMRVPLIWAQAPAAGAQPSSVTKPVGLVDLAPTFCAIADVAPPNWMQGRALPVDDRDAEARGFERVLTSWDSELFGVGVHVRTIVCDGWVCTSYGPGTVHDGSEGELYSLPDDPLQQSNRWSDPAYRAQRDDLLADLHDHEPTPRGSKLQLEAPV
jgi:arylsulfatase A-like enzyme